MASLYKRRGSPYWWIQFRDPVTRKILRQSTHFRVGVGLDLAKARKLAAEKTLAEQEGRVAKGVGWSWVPDYIDQASTPVTARCKHNRWRVWLIFFNERRIAHPHQLRRDDCLAFLPWRMAQRCRFGRLISRNMAAQDIVFLCWVLNEAVRRGYVTTNAASRLGLRRDQPRAKPEMTDVEIVRIRTGIAARLQDPIRREDPNSHEVDHFLRVSFEIAIHQGCRLSETHLDLYRQVDLDRREITFHAKGDHTYTTELHPGLVPLFQELRDQGRTTTYDLEADGWSGSRSMAWRNFLDSIGLKHLSFHCTRVTVISRMERSGAPESAVMRLVGHASTTVHRIYRRFSRVELQRYWPALPAAAAQTPQAKVSAETTTDGSHPSPASSSPVSEGMADPTPPPV